MEPIEEITYGSVCGSPFQPGDRVRVIGVTPDEPKPIVEAVRACIGKVGSVEKLLYGGGFSGSRYPFDPGVHVTFDDGEEYTFRPEELIDTAHAILIEGTGGQIWTR